MNGGVNENRDALRLPREIEGETSFFGSRLHLVAGIKKAGRSEPLAAFLTLNNT